MFHFCIHFGAKANANNQYGGIWMLHTVGWLLAQFLAFCHLHSNKLKKFKVHRRIMRCCIFAFVLGQIQMQI